MKLTRHSLDKDGNQLYTDQSNRICDGAGKLVKSEGKKDAKKTRKTAKT